MPSAVFHHDTEVLNLDSPQSGVPLDRDGDGFLDGDTLPLDYGETQRLDHSGDMCAGGAEAQEWGRTQVLDDFQDTAIIHNDSDNEGGLSERTEVLRDEGLVDEVGEVESGFRSKDGNLVDPDASTDGEEGCVGNGAAFADVSSSLQLTGGSSESNIECSRKSFVDIRVAAVRSFGFAAASRRTCKPPYNKTDSFKMEEEKYNKCNPEKAKDTLTGMKASSISDLNLAGTKDGNVLDHDAENSFRHIECYRSDNVLYQEQNNTIWSERNKEKWASPCPLICDHGAAGLSYISSQEPGVQSQDNALDVVDKFISVNDLGLSQDIKNGKTDTAKSPATASRKRAECFAKKCDRRAAGNMQVYEWIDFLEDEGGGELFSRKKFFFDSKRKKRGSHSLPLEAKIGGYESVIGIDKSSNEGGKSRTFQKLTSLSSDSRLKHISSKRNVDGSQTRLKRVLFNDFEKQENTETLKQLERKDADKIDEAVYDVGPDTQMAAEAIEALSHGSPAKFEQISRQSNIEELAGISTEIEKSKKTCSKAAPIQKRSNKSLDFEGIMTRSKRQSSYTKPRTKRSTSSRKQSSNKRMKVILEESTAKITSNMTTKKAKNSSKGVDSLNNGKSVASIIRDTVNDTVDDTFNEKVEMHPVQNTRPSFNEKCCEGTTHMYTSPVAHRTRSSKAAKILKLNKTLSDGPCKDIIRINTCAHRTVEAEDDIVSNLGARKVNEYSCNMSLNGITDTDNKIGGHADACNMEGVDVEEARTSHDKDAYREPKRLKMNQNVSDNPRSDCKMDSHSKSVDILASTVVKPSTQKRKPRVFIRSVAEILDIVKRKKRSISLSRKLESDGGLPSNEGNMEKLSGTRTRSSMLSHILKFANYPHFKTQQLSYKPAPDGTTNTCATSAGKQILHPNKPEKSKEAPDSRLLLEVEKSINPEQSPNGIGQPGLPSSPLGTHAISPVFISQDTSRKYCRKSLSKSAVARELNRLEASETPFSLNYKDMRRRKDISSFQVCFSHHLSEDVIKQQKKTLARLGIQVVSSSSAATHFVADKFVRTRNMLEAMAMGKPVVTPMWIESCGQTRHYIDEKNYILRDAKKEKEIGFSMPASLARACQHPLLQGKRVFITPKTKPGQELISSLVKAADGQPLKRIGRSIVNDDTQLSNLLILSSEEDIEVCMPLLEKGAEVFSSELLLNGIVVQKLEYERHRLFVDHVKRTRSTMWLRGEDGKEFHPVKKCT